MKRQLTIFEFGVEDPIDNEKYFMGFKIKKNADGKKYIFVPKNAFTFTEMLEHIRSEAENANIAVVKFGW